MKEQDCSTYIKKVPNYTMLRLMIIETISVKKRYPNIEQMPFGNICPGYDIDLMPILAVLKYLHGVDTQWSCQGNHKKSLSIAYILLAPDNNFPIALSEKLLEEGQALYQVPDYDKNYQPTRNMRSKISSCFNKDEHSHKSIENLNNIFIRVVNQWANEEMIRHLDLMFDDKFDALKYYVNEYKQLNRIVKNR